MNNLVLSLFPGADLLGMAFEQEGFTVVQGPDVIFGRRIEDFHPPAGVFGGICGGPPCQAFSRLRHMVEANGYQTAPNLIPEFERVVYEAQPVWFVMENVPDAPLPTVPGYHVDAQLVEDVAVGGVTRRTRRFSFGTREGRRLHVETLALWRPDPEPAVVASAGGRVRPVAIGGSGKPKRHPRACAAGTGPRITMPELRRRQGVPEDFLAASPFSVEGQRHMLGNGVPMALGRAVARAVKAARAEVSR